ncbi:hypothetical protein ACNQFZ_07715 [Schinkia sp. CFF1]
MFDTLCLKFDYSEEAFDRLEKVFELEKEKLLCTMTEEITWKKRKIKSTKEKAYALIGSNNLINGTN